MTDGELIEAAAKAAELGEVWYMPGYRETPYIGPRFQIGMPIRYKTWNPLTDDGDALRLAVKLRINVNFEEWDGAEYICAVPQRSYQGQDEVLGNNEATATRRAIVRAAAVMGVKK